MDVKPGRKLSIKKAERLADDIISRFQLPLVKIPCCIIYAYDGGKISFFRSYETETVPRLFVLLGVLINSDVSAPVLAVGEYSLDNSERKISQIMPLTGASLLSALFEASVVEFPVFVPCTVLTSVTCVSGTFVLKGIKGKVPPEFIPFTVSPKYTITIGINVLGDSGEFAKASIYRGIRRYEKVETFLINDGKLSLTPSEWNKLKREARKIIRNLGQFPRSLPINEAVNFAEHAIRKYRLGFREVPPSSISPITYIGYKINIVKAYKDKERVVALGCVHYGNKTHPCVCLSGRDGHFYIGEIFPATKVNILGALLCAKLLDLDPYLVKGYYVYPKQFNLTVRSSIMFESEILSVRKHTNKLISPAEWNSFYQKIAVRYVYLSL